MNRKLNVMVLAIVAIPVTSALFLGCATNGGRGSNVTSSQERVYNPVTKEYEWVTPGTAPTSPGTGTSTSRSSYR